MQLRAHLVPSPWWLPLTRVCWSSECVREQFVLRCTLFWLGYVLLFVFVLSLVINILTKHSSCQFLMCRVDKEEFLQSTPKTKTHAFFPNPEINISGWMSLSLAFNNCDFDFQAFCGLRFGLNCPILNSWCNSRWLHGGFHPAIHCT